MASYNNYPRHANPHSQGYEYPQLNKDPIFKPVDSIYEGRLRQFIDAGGGYKNLMLPKFYDKARIDNGKPAETEIFAETGYIEMTQWQTPNLSRPLFKDVIPSELPNFKKARKGDNFGPGWATHWFHIYFKVPESWAKEEKVLLHWDANNEGLVYDANGTPIQALTGGGERTEFTIPKSWYEDGKEHEFYLEMACNGMFGNPANGYRLASADLVLPNLQARALYWDFWMIGDSAREMTGPQKHHAREVCIRIMDAFDPEDVKSIDKCREIAKEYLGEDFESEAVYDESTTKLPISVYAIGNCHIDTAWLWPWHESMRKIVRSWITQIRIMEQYPEYVFATSQAQQFKWLKEQHPETYAEVKQKVKEQQFIPVGGSWVENDTNMPSGESLVRQFLLGQRFFLDNFGFMSDTFWLPDTFGYSTQIPQLCRLANMPNFLTQKLSWNNINTFPHNTFNWVAIDGSQVLCHMPPANTYTASANFGDVRRSIFQHHNLYNDQTGMLLYGHGDGGGGPSPEMLEKLRRIRGLANTVGGDMPLVKVGNSVTDFYNNLRKNTKGGKTFPTWKGELYLEYHRGTYTTQAKVKYMMRTAEMLMRDLEYLATKASITSKGSYTYPHSKIQSLWEDICLCQFHDMLPGSCIEDVYRDEVWPTLTKVIKTEESMIEEASFALGLNHTTDFNINVLNNSVKLNTFPWKRETVIEARDVPGKHFLFATDDYAKDEESVNGGNSFMKLVPTASIKYPSSITKEEDIFVLSNGKLKAKINTNGVITSLYDIVNKREVIDLSKTGRNSLGGNQFVMFSDAPLNFPAWDTELYSLDTYRYVESSTKVEIVDEGPIRSSIRVQHKLSNTSTISTIISLDGLKDIDSPSMLVFECDVHWDETYKFLKVEFPVTINEEFANYETQFGLTKRPTHFNTSWDTAKFEVCSHKFADYSDFNYGVSILNDCKYGFSVHGNLMRLSLIRSPKYPDAHADIGDHHFKYALYPHKGPLGVDTVRAGWEFNDRSQGVYLPDTTSIAAVSDLFDISGDSNLILSNVKRGEDDGDLDAEKTSIAKKFTKHQTAILRIYEALGGRATATIKSSIPICKVLKTNILEEEIIDIPYDSKNNSFDIESRAFEISTYRVIFS